MATGAGCDDMILDDGICSIYSVSNTAAAGNQPVNTPTLKYQSWYKELNFETSPIMAGGQEAISVSARIRIVQNRTVQNHDVVVMVGKQYDVTRVYHGVDDESGQPISDLTLGRLVKTYTIS